MKRKMKKYVNYQKTLMLLLFKMIRIILKMIIKMHSATMLPHNISCGNRILWAKPLSRRKAHKFNCFFHFEARCFANT